MIRRATLADLPEAVGVACEFHAESVYADIPVDRAALEVFMAGLIERGAVFLSDHGIIGGVLSPAYFNPAYVFAAELFWWAPLEGRQLLKVFEGWAQESGVTLAGFQFSAQVNSRSLTVNRMFERAGYRAVETSFMKRI